MVGKPLLELPISLAVGDAIAYVREQMQTEEGLMQRLIHWNWLPLMQNTPGVWALRSAPLQKSSALIGKATALSPSARVGAKSIPILS
jgi:hypothetical protein